MAQGPVSDEDLTETLEKMDARVPVYHSEKGKESVIVSFVLSEYCINFTDYRDGIGGYPQTEFDNGRAGKVTITGGVDSGARKRSAV